MAVRYTVPAAWMRYDVRSIVNELTEAKAAVLSLTSVPYQRSWAETLQEIQLKREVAGTSRIEGAEFTERELTQALLDETPSEVLTRSQRQARAAVRCYRWIAALPDDRPIDGELIRSIHRRIVSDCDDDHCPPGVLRTHDQNVVFGIPPYRGADGGAECEKAFAALSRAIQTEFKDHDVLIQALALHYHLGAMHPFLDGNGRTARAAEALVLQRAGLRDTLFIALSNYYYDEKSSYLSVLSDVRDKGYDLTPFLNFGLKGIAIQCKRLLGEINYHISKALFRDMMNDLFGRLRSKRKRVIAKRHISILNYMLDKEVEDIEKLYDDLSSIYRDLQNPWKAYTRDLIYLLRLNTIETEQEKPGKIHIRIRLEWPTEITETAFFERVSRFPKAKTYEFLQKRTSDQEPADEMPLFTKSR